MANVKISGIAAATATLLDTHFLEAENAAGTSEKLAVSILNAFIRAQVAAQLQAGGGMTLTPSGSGNAAQLTLASSGGGSTHPGYRSGAYYKFGEMGFSNATQTPNYLSFIPTVVRSQVTVTGVDMGCNTIDATNPQVDFALYNNNSLFMPGTRLANSLVTLSMSTISAGSSRYTAFSSPITLAPGVYWRAVCCKGSPAITAVGPADNWLTSLIGYNYGTPPTTNASVWLNNAWSYATGLPADAGVSAVTTGLITSPYTAALPMLKVQ